ncbi:HupE/UreJ family protein [Hyphomicrobium sp. 2TAF46]|uniref:HupE/UreJ family protein n=1 Tax=Hyphomicrobium sp. 2TAF46 TaxID=3233019 RepID=UPI003F8DBAE8
MLRKLPLLVGAALILTAGPALAHVGAGPVDTFSHGFMHPLSGIDHVLAMVAVGLFAANLGGAALWLVPSAFVGTMIFGGALGYYGWPLPMVEEAIGASVVVMGLAIAFGVRLPTIAAMALVGLFALFHGHAHGSEGMGLGVGFLPYAAGFVCTTALLHIAGIALGLSLDRLGNTPATILKRSAGTAGAIAGVSILAGWLVT